MQPNDEEGPLPPFTSSSDIFDGLRTAGGDFYASSASTFGQLEGWEHGGLGSQLDAVTGVDDLGYSVAEQFNSAQHSAFAAVPYSNPYPINTNFPVQSSPFPYHTNSHAFVRTQNHSTWPPPSDAPIPSGLPQHYDSSPFHLTPQSFHGSFASDPSLLVPPPPPPPSHQLRRFSFSNPPGRSTPSTSAHTRANTISDYAPRMEEADSWTLSNLNRSKRRRTQSADPTPLVDSSIPEYSPVDPPLFSHMVRVPEAVQENALGMGWTGEEQGGAGLQRQTLNFGQRYGALGDPPTQGSLHQSLPPFTSTSHTASLLSGLAPSLPPAAPPLQAGPSSTPFPATTPATVTSTSSTGTFHPIVHTALAHRQKFDLTSTILPRPRRRGLSSQSQTSTHADSSEEERVEKPDKRRGGKVVVNHDASCEQCGIRIAKFIFRGTKEAVEEAFEASYSCRDCQPPEPSSRGSEAEDLGTETEATYADTLSAAVDRLAGAGEEEEKPILPSRGKPTTLTGAKRKPGDQLQCDICTRELGVGRLILTSSGLAPDYGIEVSCVQCEETYQRCSDCGGSGGPRHGVGKYRCKELFPDGRKTCQLSHLRLGTRENMEFDVWKIEDLPPDELETFIILCRDLYILNVVSSLAVPEVLEPVTSLARNFIDCQKFAVDSWVMVEPLLRQDATQPVQSPHIKRYIALRWSSPPPRKKRKGRTYKERPSTSPEQSSTLIRPGKVLAGFVIGELEIDVGNLFLAITTPSTTGEVYHSTTILMQTFLARLRDDLAILNSNRTRSAPFPPISHAWLVMFYNKSTRLYRDLMHRRGYLPVVEYCEKYEVDRKLFSRPIFLPPECQLYSFLEKK